MAEKPSSRGRGSQGARAGKARSPREHERIAIPPQPEVPIADPSAILSSFRQAEGDTYEMPLLDGTRVLIKRMRRYGQLKAFQRERDIWVRRALGGMVEEVKGVEGLTHDEAVAIYTIHKLCVKPEFPLELAAKFVEAPGFIEYFMTWIQNHAFAVLESAFLGVIEQGKEPASATPSMQPVSNSPSSD